MKGPAARHLRKRCRRSPSRGSASPLCWKGDRPAARSLRRCTSSAWQCSTPAPGINCRQSFQGSAPGGNRVPTFSHVGPGRRRAAYTAPVSALRGRRQQACRTAEIDPKPPHAWLESGRSCLVCLNPPAKREQHANLAPIHDALHAVVYKSGIADERVVALEAERS